MKPIPTEIKPGDIKDVVLVVKQDGVWPASVGFATPDVVLTRKDGLSALRYMALNPYSEKDTGNANANRVHFVATGEWP